MSYLYRDPRMAPRSQYDTARYYLVHSEIEIRYLQAVELHRLLEEIMPRRSGVSFRETPPYIAT